VTGKVFGRVGAVFEGFIEERVDVGPAELPVRREGEPVPLSCCCTATRVLRRPGKPERAINADPDSWYSATVADIGQEAFADNGS
jgi:hypothetical protein